MPTTYAMHERTATGLYDVTEYVVTASDGTHTGVVGIFPDRERAEALLATLEGGSRWEARG